MKKIIYLSILILFISFSSCEMDDFQLTQSVYIEDTDYPGLPIYSEWGYNTFGVYIDRSPFVSTNILLPAKIIVHPDTFNLSLNGIMEGGETTLKFSILGYAPEDYPDLIALNDTTFNLKGDNCIVSFTQGGRSEVLKIIEGKIFFKRAQNLYVDKEYTKCILSGTFSFKTFFGDEPVAISSGRFDLGIGYENFYNY